MIFIKLRIFVRYILFRWHILRIPRQDCMYDNPSWLWYQVTHK